MGDLARPMIGILLMLVTTGAVCGLVALQYVNAMNRRIRVRAGDAFRSRCSDRQSLRVE